MARKPKANTEISHVVVKRRQLVKHTGRFLGSVTVTDTGLEVYRRRDDVRKFGTFVYPWARVVAFQEGEGGRRNSTFALVYDESVMLRAKGGLTVMEDGSVSITDEEGNETVVSNVEDGSLVISTFTEAEKPERPERDAAPARGKKKIVKRRAAVVEEADEEADEDDEENSEEVVDDETGDPDEEYDDGGDAGDDSDDEFDDGVKAKKRKPADEDEPVGKKKRKVVEEDEGDDADDFADAVGIKKKVTLAKSAKLPVRGRAPKPTSSKNKLPVKGKLPKGKLAPKGKAPVKSAKKASLNW
jgi:hypothetical protein